MSPEPWSAKPLSSVKHSIDGKVRITYTTIIDPETVDPKAFATTAHLIQEWVPKQREVRITVVGESIFPVAIKSPRAYIDWRADYANLRYERVNVPIEIADKLIRYLSEFRIPYGAFDFVITPDDRWVMLECNPSGQWLWLHHIAGLPILTAIADLLTEDDS